MPEKKTVSNKDNGETKQASIRKITTHSEKAAPAKHKINIFVPSRAPDDPGPEPLKEPLEEPLDHLLDPDEQPAPLERYRKVESSSDK